jgi:hypothetical protein
MPTASGAETIGERLTRLRADQARVRATIQRQETNGSQFNLGGTAVTQIAYERALERERSLTAQIADLDARLAGSSARSGVAYTQTRMP